MADVEILETLIRNLVAEARIRVDADWPDEGITDQAVAVRDLLDEHKEQAERLRMFELIHGGRASEVFHQISALHDEVRRLKILAGEDVPLLPEEFVGPMPENCNARLRRKLKGGIDRG